MPATETFDTSNFHGPSRVEQWTDESTKQDRIVGERINVHYSEDEPDGEVFAAPVTVHLERMEKGRWSLILTTQDGSRLLVRLHSKRPIRVTYVAEGPPGVTEETPGAH